MLSKSSTTTDTLFLYEYRKYYNAACKMYFYISKRTIFTKQNRLLYLISTILRLYTYMAYTADHFE